MPLISYTNSELDLEKLRELVSDPERADEALPKEEREGYDEAQQSVVDARRKAELYEGLLQVN